MSNGETSSLTLKDVAPAVASKRPRPRLRAALGSLWPNVGRSVLPSRVAAAIDANDNVSEVLVKLLQLGVFSLWGLFYLATPSPDPSTISRVPVVVSLYLLFTFALLMLAVRKHTPPWLIYLSITVDMMLLTYLIWSFHEQYEQPASFSLKAVEMMNFFVLIALRALRFEARYVAYAGFAAIACWAALVVYVTQTDPADPMVTRDYVTYLTSNTVLIGAEISKMISLAMFTIILAISVRRAHAFLVSAIAERNAAEDLSRFVSEGAAEQIREADHRIEAGEGVRREAAIVNVDIRGFTAIAAELSPDQTMALLSGYQKAIVPLVHKHGGVVDKFMGDGIMITFGAAGDDPGYCANALRLVEDLVDLRSKLAAADGGLRINIAVDAGSVVFGAVGEGDRLEYTVIGPAVNRSAKLEKFNKEIGSVAVATKSAYALAVKQGYRPADGQLPSENIYHEGVRNIPLMVM
ncbi:MAG: adenylate/guanylate cyclase domain-containing protein, partial [Pseudomonadota bacterium]